MADLVKRTNSQMQSSEHSEKFERIVLALGEMSLLRGATPSAEQLTLYAQMLMSYPLEAILPTLRKFGETPRSQHEPAFPEFSRILLEIREYIHPLKVLRQAVRRLAQNFGVTPTEALMESFEETCWHRTDKDIQAAYLTLLKYTSVMPNVKQFREACGELRRSRYPGTASCNYCLEEGSRKVCRGVCPRNAESQLVTLAEIEQ